MLKICDTFKTVIYLTNNLKKIKIMKYTLKILHRKLRKLYSKSNALEYENGSYRKSNFLVLDLYEKIKEIEDSISVISSLIEKPKENDKV